MSEKKYEELTISDDFIFGKVMSDPQILKGFLQRVLPHIDFTDLKIVVAQYTVDPYYGSHGVRLDVYAKDERHLYSIEMQVGHYELLPKRSRYYQSAMDMEDLVKGEAYSSLKEQYIIFITPEDPFHDKLFMYRYENTCIENGKSLSDGTQKIFINCSGKNIDAYPELKPFAEYVKGKLTEKDRYVRELDEAVRAARKNPVWRREYMNYQDHLRIEREEGEKRGIEKGLKRGIEKGLKQGIEKGLKQGETNRTLSLIRRYMRMKNCSFEDACHALFLTEEETQAVRKLIREN